MFISCPTMILPSPHFSVLIIDYAIQYKFPDSLKEGFSVMKRAASLHERIRCTQIPYIPQVEQRKRATGTYVTGGPYYSKEDTSSAWP